MSEAISPKRSAKGRPGGGAHKVETGTGKKPAKPVDLADRTLACRFEMKYHITESKAQAISQFVRQYIEADRYCKLQRGGDYPIVSLYLDSQDLRLYRESMDGLMNRFKLRIRSYTDEREYPCFFEIKRRINTIIMKSRARVMHRDLPTLLAGLPLPPQNYHVDEEALNQFQLYMSSIKAHPVVLIRYMRQAYEGDSQNRIRVTFDRELCYKVTNSPEVTLSGPGWQRNPFTLGGVILEIKFTGCYPAWLNRMVKYFGLRARSISKYASSINDSALLGFCAPSVAG
jgi:hypothetical protein